MGVVTTFVMSLLHGLVYGMVLFLLASGLTLIFGMMGVLNFAHGALYMLGAYVSFSVLVWTGQFWLSLIVAPWRSAFVGMFMERFFLRKVHGYGHVSELLLTFGVAYILEDIVKLVWGTEPIKVDVPAILSGSVPILGAPFPVYRLFILLVAFLTSPFLSWSSTGPGRASSSAQPLRIKTWWTPSASMSPWSSCSSSVWAPGWRASPGWSAVLT